MTTQQLAAMTLDDLDALQAEMAAKCSDMTGPYSQRARARFQIKDVEGEIDRRVAQERA